MGIDRAASEWAPAISGVPQGLVLGPVLFIVYSAPSDHSRQSLQEDAVYNLNPELHAMFLPQIFNQPPPNIFTTAVKSLLFSVVIEISFIFKDRLPSLDLGGVWSED